MENPKSYKPSRRSWIKLWVDEWLGGTTRFELSEKQRSIWIDLLALAGKSRFPGIIASGKYEDGFRGYPLAWYAGTLVYDQQDFMEALKACEKYGKIKIEHRSHDGIDNIVVHVINFEKYQSEYLRQRPYSTKKEGREDDEKLAVFAQIYETDIGIITPAIGEELKDLSNQFSEEWFQEAVKEACSNNARKLSYVKAILNRWQVDGFKSKTKKKGQFTDKERPKVQYQKVEEKGEYK